MCSRPTRLDHRKHRRFFETTEQMRRLRQDPEDITQDEYRRIMAQLCDALNLSKENGLEDAIRYFGQVAQQPNELKEAQAIIDDYDLFLTFLKFEKDLLVQCGATAAAAQDIIDCIEQMKNEVGIDLHKIDTDKAVKTLNQLQAAACSVKNQVANFTASEEEQYKRKQHALRVYGGSLAAANLAALAITLASSAVFTTVSAGIGSLMLTFEGKLKNPRDRRPKRKK